MERKDWCKAALDKRDAAFSDTKLNFALCCFFFLAVASASAVVPFSLSVGGTSNRNGEYDDDNGRIRAGGRGCAEINERKVRRSYRSDASINVEDAPGVLDNADNAFDPPPAIASDVRIPVFLMMLLLLLLLLLLGMVVESISVVAGDANEERSGMSMSRDANRCGRGMSLPL